MFKDLKEYQDITRIYNESVNISEEQRAINKIFVEEDFTLEELDYLEENWDELWENELAQFTQECISESFEEQELTEEQIQQIDEVLGLKLLAKGALKANKAIGGIGKGLKSGLKSAKTGIGKGLKSAKTAVGDTLRGAGSVAKSAIKKVGGAIKKAAPIIGKGALLGTGAALPIAGAVGGVMALRDRGKRIRDAKEKGKSAGDAAKKIADAKEKGKEAGDAARKLADAGAAAGGASEVKGGNKVADAGAAGAKGAQDAKGTKKLLSTPMKDTTELGSKVRQVKPGSARDKMIAKNEARHGKDSITNRRNMNADFQAYKKGKLTKAQFIDKYPKSITAQRAKGLRDHTEWDAYDMVLEYLFSTDQVATLEEANYVMMEMDQQTIGEIVTEVKQELHELLPLAGLALGALGVNKLRKRGKAKREAGKAAAGAVGGAAGKGGSMVASVSKKKPGGAAGKAAGAIGGGVAGRAAGAVGGALAGAAGSKGPRKKGGSTGAMSSTAGRAAGPRIEGRPMGTRSATGPAKKSKIDLSGKTKAQIMALKRLGKIQ